MSGERSPGACGSGFAGFAEVKGSVRTPLVWVRVSGIASAMAQGADGRGEAVDVSEMSRWVQTSGSAEAGSPGPPRHGAPLPPKDARAVLKAKGQ